MTVVLLVIGAFVCGAGLCAAIFLLVERAPDIEWRPELLDAVVADTTDHGLWIVDPTGSLLNVRHFRVLTVAADQVVGEWATASSFDAESLVAVVSCTSPAMARRALRQLAEMLHAVPVAA